MTETANYRRRKPASKLQIDDIVAIRAAYEAGETQGALARKHGVSIGHIGRIVRREIWHELATETGDPIVK